ncbi:MAG: type II secretion system protein GspM [Pseudomonadota bacterium]|nr:type II secretion system protein GspM [Pseudomonadota bacterium]
MASITIVEPMRERFAQLVATMSPRDRTLFVGLVVFAVVALLGGAWWVSRSILGDVRSRVEQREETLALLSALAADQAEAAAQVETIEAELRKSDGQDLPSFIEKSAEKVGIATNLQGVREKQVVTEGSLEEKTYSVEVSKILLPQLTDFLYAIETGGYPLRVRSMKTKSVTTQGVKMLTVSMEISAFRLLDSSAEASTEEETP